MSNPNRVKIERIVAEYRGGSKYIAKVQEHQLQKGQISFAKYPESMILSAIYNEHLDIGKLVKKEFKIESIQGENKKHQRFGKILAIRTIFSDGLLGYVGYTWSTSERSFIELIKLSPQPGQKFLVSGTVSGSEDGLIRLRKLHWN